MATKPARSSEYVSIACKLPQGLHVKVPEKGIDIKLHGSNTPFAVAGFGLTEVKTQVWEAIVEFYKDHPGAKWLHNETVFAQNKRESAIEAAEERKGFDAGFEAVDPNNPSKAARTSAMIQVEGSRDPGEGS